MKIIITGHTKGVGLALYKQLDLNGHWVIGFSKSTGNDIGTIDGREQILKVLADSDVFINNAYHVTGQFDLLKAVTELWAGTNKLIININSKAIFAEVVHPSMVEYIEAKKQQHEYITAKRLESRPQLLNVNLGLVNTAMSAIFNAKKLSTADVANLIATLVDYKDTVYVQDITLDVPDQNWTEIKGQ